MVAAYEQCEPSIHLETLDSAAQSVVDECGVLIQDTLDHLCPKYQESFRVGGSGRSRHSDVLKKIWYAFRETGRLNTVRDRLRESVLRLNLLTNLTTL